MGSERGGTGLGGPQRDEAGGAGGALHSAARIAERAQGPRHPAPVGVDPGGGDRGGRLRSAELYGDRRMVRTVVADDAAAAALPTASRDRGIPSLRGHTRNTRAAGVGPRTCRSNSTRTHRGQRPGAGAPCPLSQCAPRLQGSRGDSAGRARALQPDFRKGAAGRLGAQGPAPRHALTRSRRGVLLRSGARLTLRDSGYKRQRWFVKQSGLSLTPPVWRGSRAAW